MQEVIRDGENGLLVDFFDGDALASRIADVLNQRDRYQCLADAARSAMVTGYDLKSVCLPGQLALVDRLVR